MSKFVSVALVAIAAMMLVCSAAQAALETGEPLAHGTWVPNSTNALNYAKLVPGREGQTVPYVLFDSATTDSVSLLFTNGAPGLAFFEVRIDGIATGVTSHPVVAGSTIHTGGTGIPQGGADVLRVISATQYVDVRLALGGERDWDFDWVRFRVAAVPEPTTFVVWSMLGVCAASMRRRHVA